MSLPVYFAPLQGYTDVVYRKAHAALFGGIAAYYTPFVRIEKGDFRRKDLRDIDFENNLSLYWLIVIRGRVYCRSLTR